MGRALGFTHALPNEGARRSLQLNVTRTEQPPDSMRRFGVLIASLALLALTGCFYSFAGGGLPPHIHTMAIVTFDNQTPSPDLPKELYERCEPSSKNDLAFETRRRTAPTPWCTGRFSPSTRRARWIQRESAASGECSAAICNHRRRRDPRPVERKGLYTGKGLREEADYAERAEPDGRAQAISKIVQKIIEGVQSNW